MWPSQNIWTLHNKREAHPLKASIDFFLSLYPIVKRGAHPHGQFLWFTRYVCTKYLLAIISPLHFSGFRRSDELFQQPYYLDPNRHLHSPKYAKFHPTYIKFVEDAMLVLFLLCVLITLLVVHRGSCYRLVWYSVIFIWKWGIRYLFLSLA